MEEHDSKILGGGSKTQTMCILHWGKIWVVIILHFAMCMAVLPWLQHGLSCTTLWPGWLPRLRSGCMCVGLLSLNQVGIKLHGRLEAVGIHVWFLTNHGLPLKGGCPNTNALFDL